MDLKKYIENNNLILPDYNNLNIVELMKFLYSKYGIDIKSNNEDNFSNLINLKKHTVFILIDGMGSNLINLLPDNSVLKQHKVEDMITVCPSSTGCVLTSVATATYPSEHGIIGWYNYNREHDIDYYPLLFTDRDGNDLNKKGINVNDIFKIDSKLNKLNVKTKVLYPEYIYDSVYSNYAASSSIRNSYSDLDDAFKKLKSIVYEDESTFTYLYIPYIDDLEHDYGYDSKEVMDKLIEIDNLIKDVINSKDTTIIITADHGQTNVDINKDIIMDFNEYDKYFYAKPGIDFGMSTYYVKKDKINEFETKFYNDYKNKMYLFQTDEFLKNKVFGPNKYNDYLKSNLGEYISLCESDSQFINSDDIESYYKKTKGNHSGLSKDEMIIPLIVIECN